MKVLNTCLFMTSLLFACGQENREEKAASIPSDESETTLSAYIQQIDDQDSTCMKDIALAKQDVSKGKIVFCSPAGFLFYNLRQEEQLRELCRKNKLVFQYELFSDVIYEGQTQGCYGAYMDQVIAAKFGSGFKERLLAQADSMLLASNDTINAYDCDKRPHIPGESDEYEPRLLMKIPDKLRKQLKKDRDGYLPFMDIGFYMDKSGNTSDYFLNFFMDADHESNQKYEDELFKMGVEKLKEIHWQPGIVNGQKVITENNVRVFLIAD